MYKTLLVVALLVSQLGLAQEQPKNQEQPKDQEQGKEQEKPKELKEVVVKNETKTFTNKNGTIKVDVANSIYNTIPNVIDLLEKLPKVQVTPDKQGISIVGKGSPLLYIDNQKADMNDLNSLSVEDIKTIEIINNPSAKYEAEGRAVILITRKFSKREGYKVAFAENAMFKKYFNNYSSVNASFKTGALEFKINFNYNQMKVWESNGNDFTIPNYQIQSNYLVTAVTNRPQFIYGGGVFYKINEDDYLSLNVNRRTQKDVFNIITTTFNQDQNVINDINTLNVNEEKRDFTSGFLNYNHKSKRLGIELFSGFQYSTFNQKMASEISNNYNDNGFELAQYRNQMFGIDVGSGRIDLEKKFKNKMKIELGGLYLQADAKTNFEVATLNPATENQTLYQYKEKNIATYTQFSGSYKKWNYSLGLRAENTNVKGKYDTQSTWNVDKNFINLFPKAQLEMVIDSTNTLSMDYAKSISRPDYSSTSQTSTYINPYFVWANNINLNPTLTDEIALSYQYKDKVIRVSYSKTSNPIYYGANYNDAEKLLTFTTMNFDKETNLTIELTLPFKYKFWNTLNILSLSQNKVSDEQALVKEAKPNLYYYSNHIFTLPKKYELYITGWGLTKQQMGVFERNALFTMNAAISKTFFKHLSCSISWNDILRKMNIREDFTINSVTAQGKYYTDSHSISFSVKYFFGEIKKSEYKEKDIDENSKRIK
ncbi:outer membrane beta-barrel protein [Flavobacterium sp. N1994]|uniref:outer membrane beta-barrel protein n=1 Tax=Flavobacterium sp. N1994 TaxID=2986827 RepID=UPI00222134AF|nr:outer membrane beta-barrel protein [Flavobacterium sp. N1994]